MAAEYSGLRQTCEILTILGWQCVLLFSLGRLQFGLVEAENFCDVWFVAHVCRCSEKQTKRDLIQFFHVDTYLRNQN